MSASSPDPRYYKDGAGLRNPFPTRPKVITDLLAVDDTGTVANYIRRLEGELMALRGVTRPVRPAIFDPTQYPEDRLTQLLEAPKDSSTIHYDEDTIPHSTCDDPIHCDCMCHECWRLKADIIRAARA